MGNGIAEDGIMLARIIVPFLFLASSVWAGCLPEPVVVEAIQSVRDAPCHDLPDCLRDQRAGIERLLEEHPASLPLHRLRQDLALAAGRDDREAVRRELIEHYTDHPELSPDARRYLLARLDNDEAALREAADGIPWARLDLMRRLPERDGEALVGAAQAEELLEGFVAQCPDAAVLLAGEARQLLISVRWPVWADVRRQLLAMEPPPWDRLDSLLIRAGLLQETDGDPAGALFDELAAATGDAERDSAGYWLYRARIHLQARDIDAALAANAQAREADPCRQLAPMQRMRPEQAGSFDDDWVDGVVEQVMNCPPDFEVYQDWMFAVSQQPELLEPEPLARIRRAVEARALDHATPRLRKQLARIDICCSRHDPEAAWAALEELHEQSLGFMERTDPGPERASYALSIAIGALDLTRLGLAHDFPEQAARWQRVADGLIERHQGTLRQEARSARLMDQIDSMRSEVEWLRARNEERHADAVVHALEARARRHPWIDMDEVLASWRSAGGTEAGFEQLLEVWEMELPAEWRGWRRLGEPLGEFELADLDDRTWTRADLDGKRTLVNLWAVWCGPCLLELPKVQELHDRYRDDPDVQVLTVNLEDAPGVARELMRREGYDFPVLMHDGDEPAFDGVGIPRNWLVDGDGIRQWEQTGFVPAEADHWVEDIVSLIEQMGQERRPE
jgi:thiol-disulfide isomerase/thioredoxin/tetratricopeptide (TPR) repeat protein